MSISTARVSVIAAMVAASAGTGFAQQEKLYRVDLAYRAPGNGPRPNFSPYGTQLALSDLPMDAALPAGAMRPAKTGTLRVGPDRKSWISILASADAAHPHDLCRLYIDRNRNGDFADDGPALTAEPRRNEKTQAWWSSFNGAEFSIPYSGEIVERYTVNFWIVREGDDPPGLIRYSVASWRSGSITVNGVDALVAVMDADNDAIFDDKDKWSVLGETENDAARRVLSFQEARPTNRLMFVNAGGRELVLEFRSLTPDGRSLTFAVVNRPVTKAQDRAPDDTLAAERARPRTGQPFRWMEGDLDRAVARARESGRKLIVDFWTSWCGPCHSLDEWIWTDADIAEVLNSEYVGVKLDGDLAKDLVIRYHVAGYPTILVLDGLGHELQRFGYLSSREMLQALRR